MHAPDNVLHSLFASLNAWRFTFFFILIYVLSLTIIYTYEASNFICLPRFVLISTHQCIYFIAFRLCVFAPIYTTAFTPFVYAGLLRLKVCPSPCSCLPPYLPFNSLKLLLLFVTFQTSTLTNVLCGSIHTFRAFIGRCYANIAFSSSVLCRTFLYAFITKVQCGLPSRLLPTFARCRCRCFAPVSSGGAPCIAFRRRPQPFAALACLAVCVVCVVLCSFRFAMQRYGNYLEYTIKIHTIF